MRRKEQTEINQSLMIRHLLRPNHQILSSIDRLRPPWRINRHERQMIRAIEAHILRIELMRQARKSRSRAKDKVLVRIKRSNHKTKRRKKWAKERKRRLKIIRNLQLSGQFSKIWSSILTFLRMEKIEMRHSHQWSKNMEAGFRSF